MCGGVYGEQLVAGGARREQAQSGQQRELAMLLVDTQDTLRALHVVADDERFTVKTIL